MTLVKECLETLAAGKDLSYEVSKEIFARFFDGQLEPAQSGALLMGLRTKGESEHEVWAAVETALKRARTIENLAGPLIDTCGTGGDGKHSFNCSTAVALFLADMGFKVVKHGNRAVSSKCGSADIVEQLGFPLVQDPEEAKEELEAKNFVFLFAPYFHPAFKNVVPIRKQLGIRTLFNLMGPLLNPAHPTHQIIGVPQKQFLSLVAKVLAKKRIECGCVVYGAGGFDELTPCGVNQVVLVENEKLQNFELDPGEYGFSLVQEKDLICPTKEQALIEQKKVLRGEGPKALQEMVALNLGMVLYLLKQEADLKSCFDRARHKVAQGISNLKLNL
ncbi:MAG: anthranilate phosphoribosyltransferase [Desulfonauticus sp.]|nr:anthranilate phosphoribosyltransferase [Desulfonauticus sp.]